MTRKVLLMCSLQNIWGKHCSSASSYHTTNKSAFYFCSKVGQLYQRYGKVSIRKYITYLFEGSVFHSGPEARPKPRAYTKQMNHPELYINTPLLTKTGIYCVLVIQKKIVLYSLIITERLTMNLCSMPLKEGKKHIHNSK